MFKRSAVRIRIGLVSATVVALLALSAGSVAADTTPGGDGTYSQNGKSADAWSGDCVSNGDGTTTCEDANLSVFAGKMSDSASKVTHSNQVCVSIGSWTYVDETGETLANVFESGCEVDLPSGTLAFGSKLTTATLAATTVTIQQFICDDVSCEPGPTRDVTVDGSWTGIGTTTFSKYRSVYADDICRFAEAGKGYNREASFSGTIAGEATGADTYGWMSDGKYTFRSRCIEV